MYNILELRRKSQEELLQIAQELGVKKANSLTPDALIYAILDQQAIVTSVDKKDDSKTKKQRTRIAKKVVTEEGGINVVERKPVDKKEVVENKQEKKETAVVVNVEQEKEQPVKNIVVENKPKENKKS